MREKAERMVAARRGVSVQAVQAAEGAEVRAERRSGVRAERQGGVYAEVQAVLYAIAAEA